MHALVESLRHSPFFRAAVAAPIAIMFIFSFFTLTAAPDPARVAKAITLGIVNLDEGAPMLPIKVGDQLIAGLSANAPFATRTLDSEVAGRGALDAGEVSALLILPAEFTKAVAERGAVPVPITIVTSQHLSAMESQLAAAIPAQLQLGINTALGTMAKMFGIQGAPTVQATVETLHVSPSGAASVAPVTATQAIWLAGFVGALMLFLATRGAAAPASAVATLRSVLPLASTFVATLVLALTVSSVTGDWRAFLPFWGVAWLGAYAVTLLAAGTFALIGLWAILIVLPLAFWQPILSGAQMPLGGAPDWLRRVGELAPFDALPAAFRSLLIGGTDHGFLAAAAWAVVLGLALVWAGTYGWAMIRPAPTAAHA
jgi:hypothetical protein